MKNLETLIQELCPDGVEFVKLGDVCEIKTGKGITQKDCSESDKYPVYSGGKEPMGYYKEFNRNANTVTVSRVGAYAGFVNYVTEDFYLNDKCFSVLPKKDEDINSKYLYYKLKALECSIINMQSGGGVPTINTKKVGSLEIPLPPIKVQTEIVRILDKFTSLEAELEAELDCRKRQYEYYRDKLLSFENVGGQEVEWKKMSEVGTFIRGNGLQKKDFTESGVGCIHYGQIYTKFNTFTDKTLTYCSENVARKLTPVHPGDLIIACTSENVEDVCKTVAWLGKEDIVTGGHACVFSHHENPKYIAYLLQTENFFQQKKKYARGVKVIDIKVADLQKITLPIPSLEEQQRIVSILDRFESLTTSLQSGLPAEIVARRQQYEHYRDKLLTFKRKGAA